MIVICRIIFLPLHRLFIALNALFIWVMIVISLIVSVKAKNATKAAVKWNEIPADGYEIFMAQGKTGKYKKVKTITKGETVSYTKSSLKAGNTYYFYIKAYKTVGDAKIYGGTSNVKTVSIK